MADLETTVVTNYVVADKATANLARIQKAAAGAGGLFDKMSSTLMGFQGAAAAGAAALGFGSIIKDTAEHLKQIQRISNETGISAQRAEGLVEVFQQANIEGAQSERILMGMSRRAMRYEQQMSGVGRMIGGQAQMFQRLGISIQDGPEKMLVGLAEQAQKGKLNAVELGMALGVPGRNAVDLIRLLKKGPGAIKEAQEEARKYGIATDENMETLRDYQSAQIAIREAWEKIKRAIGAPFLRVVADLMKDMAEKMGTWVEAAQSFGKVLSGFLHEHYALVIKIGEALLANAAVQKLTGTGIVGNVGGMYSKAKGGGVMGMAPGLAGGGIAASVATAGTLMLLYKVVQGVGQILTNAGGVTDWLLEAWDRIRAHFMAASKATAPIAKLFSEDGVIGQFFTYLIPSALGGLLIVVENIIQFVQVIARTFQKTWASGGSFWDFGKNFSTVWDEVSKETDANARQLAAERKAKAAMEGKTPDQKVERNMIFNNARFDIKQEFAEGFDPDRIAVAFANDLAAMGERKLSSGFAPAFSSR